MPLRELTEHDAALLEPFVVMAAFPPGERVSPEVLDLPHARRWLDGWGRELGVAWEENGELVGAAWARAVDPVLAHDATGAPLPELVIAVAEQARGTGVGQRLMEGLLDLALERRVPGLVLTVSERNPAAVRLYEQAGFEHAGRTSSGLLAMLWRPDA